MTRNLAGLRTALPGDHRSDAIERATTPPDVTDDEPMFGAGAAIVLAAVIGALFWVAIYTLVF